VPPSRRTVSRLAGTEGAEVVEFAAADGAAQDGRRDVGALAGTAFKK